MRWAGSSTRGRVAAEGRLCAHPGCSGVAGATMTYDYASRTAWVDDLSEVPSPAGYDLCAPHTAAFSVPRGWMRSDRRGGTADTTPDDEALVSAPAS